MPPLLWALPEASWHLRRRVPLVASPRVGFCVRLCYLFSVCLLPLDAPPEHKLQEGSTGAGVSLWLPQRPASHLMWSSCSKGSEWEGRAHPPRQRIRLHPLPATVCRGGNGLPSGQGVARAAQLGQRGPSTAPAGWGRALRGHSEQVAVPDFLGQSWLVPVALCDHQQCLLSFTKVAESYSRMTLQDQVLQAHNGHED